MPELQFINTDRKWNRVDITTPRFRVGRHEDCDLVVDDAWTSREHFAVADDGSGRYVLEDLKSENGTFVNSRRVTHHVLGDGDVVRIGRTEFRFRQQEPAAVAASSPGMATTLALETVGPEGETLLRRRVAAMEKRWFRAQDRTSSLEVENAVLRRILEKAGISVPDAMTRVDDERPVRLPRSLLSRVLNPRLRMLFSRDPDESPDPRRTRRLLPYPELQWAFVGLGGLGDRLCGALLDLGRTELFVVHTSPTLTEDVAVPPGRVLRLGDRDDDGPSAEALAQCRPDVGMDGASDVFLLAHINAFSDEGGPLTLLPALCSALGLDDPDGPDRTRIHAVLAVDPLRARKTPALADWKSLAESSRVRVVFPFDHDRLSRLPREGRDARAPLRTIAGHLDSLDRLAAHHPLAGEWTALDLASLLAEGGFGVLGAADTAGLEPAELANAALRSLREGAFWPPGEFEAALGLGLVAVVGARAVDRNPTIVNTLHEILQGIVERFPRVTPRLAVFEDGGSTVRFFSILVGLRPRHLFS